MGRIAGVTADQTRDRLLAAAKRVLQRHGYAGATVALIAAEAGLSSGAIYTHFVGRTELLVAALHAHRDEAMSGLFAAPDAAGSVPERLVTLGLQLRDRPDRDATLLLEALLAARRDQELAGVLAASVTERADQVATMIRRAQDEAQFTTDVSADATARFALMLGIGAIVIDDLDLADVDADEWSAFIHRFIAAFTQES